MLQNLQDEKPLKIKVIKYKYKKKIKYILITTLLCLQYYLFQQYEYKELFLVQSINIANCGKNIPYNQ